MNLWFDIIMPSDVFFFNSIITDLIYNKYITVRDRSETIDLANNLKMEYSIVGRDYSQRTIKSLNVIYRTICCLYQIPKFDISLSFENSMCVFTSKIRQRPSIIYCDNDLELVQRTFIKSIETKVKAQADYIIVPLAYDITGLLKEGAEKENIIQYNGYKEDVYIADYIPDPKFTEKLPFENFVVVRPEAFFAAYVKESRSIVPELLASFVKNDFNVVYIPRIKSDIKYAKGLNVYIPKKPLNGLDLCYYASGILTGSGTMAREAACMGTPSVSFFPSKILLSVDKQLINEGKILHSRDIENIVDYIKYHNKDKQQIQLDRCKKVKKDVVKITKDIVDEFNMSI